MDALYLLIPISVLLIFVIGLVFWWALNNRQFDSLDEAGGKILEDSDTPSSQSTSASADRPENNLQAPNSNFPIK